MKPSALRKKPAFPEEPEKLPAPAVPTKDLISIHDLPVETVHEILTLAAHMKKNPAAYRNALAGKQLAMLFEKPSLRTRASFEVGMYELGGHAVYFGPSEVGLGRRESVPDVARNLSRWFHGITLRAFRHETVIELAATASIPVINALSDLLHPCQALADYFTLQEHMDLRGLTLAFVGDGNNVAHSLAFGAAKLGVTLRIATPEGYEPNARLMGESRADARSTGGRIATLHDPAVAVSGADAVYTDVWTSMGQEAEAEIRRTVFRPYQVDRELMARARPGAFFLHCLPARRGEEVTAEVIDSPYSLAFEQAENRLHVAKAILYLWLH